MPRADTKKHGSVLFDGYCNYCSGWVNFIMKHDKKDYFRFAAVQTQPAKQLLEDRKIVTTDLPDSVLLIEGDRLFTKSTAGLRILKQLRFPFPLFYTLIIIPAFIRDVVYNYIISKRYKWYGKRSDCRVPVTTEEKKKFIG